MVTATLTWWITIQSGPVLQRIVTWNVIDGRGHFNVNVVVTLWTNHWFSDQQTLFVLQGTSSPVTCIPGDSHTIWAKLYEKWRAPPNPNDDNSGNLGSNTQVQNDCEWDMRRTETGVLCIICLRTWDQPPSPDNSTDGLFTLTEASVKSTPQHRWWWVLCCNGG